MKRKVTLQNTDASGAIYFTVQLQFALEAFEEFLAEKGIGLNVIFSQKKYSMPIVHAQSDYLAPLRVGDEIVVEIFLDSLGLKSFSMGFFIKKEGIVVGKGKIVHAIIDRDSGLSIVLPEDIKNLLKSLS